MIAWVHLYVLWGLCYNITFLGCVCLFLLFIYGFVFALFFIRVFFYERNKVYSVSGLSFLDRSILDRSFCFLYHLYTNNDAYRKICTGNTNVPVNDLS